ncbi:MAG: metallophosphoesterase [Clostridiales bacterium]|nr:metallophosphoesterase [Clostridiales bacterium]
MVKKLLALTLCLAVAVPLVFICGAESGDGLNIAVASDLHYCQPSETLERQDGIDDEIYWYANRRAAMEDESGFIIDEFLRQCEENESDIVFISGDLVNDGRVLTEQHEDVAKKLDDFEKRSKKRVFVIDGNHDLGYNSATDVEDFKRIYDHFGYDEALEIDSESCSYTADLTEKYRLIALDSCDHSKSTEDGLTLKRMAWFVRQAKKAKSDGKFIILMMHHNLLDHMPVQRILSRNFIVRTHRSYAETFADMGVRVVFTGHEHCSDAAGYISALGNRIYDFATTSLTMYPLQYRMVSFSDEKIDYSVKTVDKIDTDALTNTVGGYTEEQTALMNEGLNSYALGFLRAGVRYRLELQLSMEKIGISEGKPFYKTVKTAVDELKKILSMPLYGEDSVSSLAKGYNIDVPESGYKNGWELATDFVAAHYAGGERSDLDSAETKILLRIVELVLRDVPTNVGDEVYLKAANEIIKGDVGAAEYLTKTATKLFGAATPGEYFLLAVLSPVIYEFAYDSDGIDDNNGSIEGYAAENSSAFQNLSEKYRTVFQKILYYIKLFFRYAFLGFVR